jgi:hypothetical protein
MGGQPQRGKSCSSTPRPTTTYGVSLAYRGKSRRRRSPPATTYGVSLAYRGKSRSWTPRPTTTYGVSLAYRGRLTLEEGEGERMGESAIQAPFSTPGACYF